MLLLKTNAKTLSTRTISSFKGRSPLFTSRSFTSSLLHKKEQNGGATTGPTRLNITVDDKEKCSKSTDAQEPFVSPSVHNLSFMPVTHLSQTEFAHNAFFSLYRPLLGLEDDKMDKPFFSNTPLEEDHVDVNEQISNYMMTLRPFEVPAPSDIMDHTKEQDHMAFFNTNEPMQHAQQEDEEDYYMDHSLPMYYMPESDDLVEYLTTMQQRFVRQNAFYDSISSSDVVSPMGRTKRRLEKHGLKASITSSSTVRSKQHKQGLYRHRWNK